MDTATIAAPTAAPGTKRLPVVTLVFLAVVGFVLVTMETIPAGLLPIMAEGLNTSEGTIGLLVSAYALGTVIVTVPAIALTRGVARKPLLLVALAGLILANTVTAVSGDVVLSLVSRFIAGSFSGVIWGMLAVYGRTISPPSRSGLALAIVSTGAPVGFALGTPLGSWLGTTFDWRLAFVGLTVVAAVAAVVLALIAPSAPGQPTGASAPRLPVLQVLRLPGVAIVLAVILVWMLAHNTIYTYSAPYLRTTSGGLTVDVLLFIFGVSSIGGIVVVGALLDRHPRALLHGSLGLFIVAAVALLVGHESTQVVIAATILWGVTFGGAPAQLQAALTTAGGRNSDVANSFLPVGFNVAIFLAGILGAALLTTLDGGVLPVVMIVFGASALVLTLYGRRAAFPATALIVVCLSGCAADSGEMAAPSPTPPPAPRSAVTPIVFELDGIRIAGQLDNSAASASLIAQLPLSTTFRDYGGQEIIGELPEPLDLEGASDGSAAPAFTIGYYVPQQSMVLYYESVGYFGGIVPIGTFEASDAVKDRVGEFTVSIHAR